MIKKILPISLAALFSVSPVANAGFFSTFFANVASDSFQKNGRGNSTPNLKEKKIQAALGVMALYNGKLDGDLDTFESRTGIKKFQGQYNLDQTGFLTDTEKSQLVYLSNLYVSLKKKGVTESKKIAIYNEIDSTTDSMVNKTLIEEYLPFLSDDKYKLRITSEHEDATVYIDGKKSWYYSTRLLYPISRFW
ncbi:MULTISPECIES: hypothetical protein [unclassified Pseudoalteromonas]|uniref:hypothetical protein n=1 Tax=unclassified Pseudoalteromonas TaxID=194690 RepID=UPI0005A88D77|nr:MULTISPECIES: hypothetical protein [unclassified Pseudoalteromonas]